MNAILDTITDALARGDRVELRGFGAFSVKRRDARNGRNPRTGEAVAVGEKHIPVFKTGKEMRKRLNLRPARDADGSRRVAEPDHHAGIPQGSSSCCRSRSWCPARGREPAAGDALARPLRQRRARDQPSRCRSLPLILVAVALGVMLGGVGAWLGGGKHRRARRLSSRESNRLRRRGGPSARRRRGGRPAPPARRRLPDAATALSRPMRVVTAGEIDRSLDFPALIEALGRGLPRRRHGARPATTTRSPARRRRDAAPDAGLDGAEPAPASRA